MSVCVCLCVCICVKRKSHLPWTTLKIDSQHKHRVQRREEEKEEAGRIYQTNTSVISSIVITSFNITNLHLNIHRATFMYCYISLSLYIYICVEIFTHCFYLYGQKVWSKRKTVQLRKQSLFFSGTVDQVK